MEIAVKEFEQTELITIHGRVDSVGASRLELALEAANYRGKYRPVVDIVRWSICPVQVSVLWGVLNVIASVITVAKWCWRRCLTSSGGPLN